MPTMAGAGELDTSGNAYQPYVDTSCIRPLPDTPAKRAPFKSFDEILALHNCGKKNDVKQIIRESPWPLDNPIRKKLWPLLCLQHARDSVEPGYYWEMVKQLYGTTDLPEKPLMLPQFLEPNRCLSYHLTKQGRFAADRVACVLSYSCPDITYSPVVYPIIALLLHFVPEEDCYNSIACLVACKDKVFVTQTKLLYEVTWRTVMQIAKKHVKSAVVHISRSCNESAMDRFYSIWVWWVMQELPFTHLVRVVDCFLHEGIKVLYRIAMAILVLFTKQQHSAGGHDDVLKAGVDIALAKFCKDISVTPTKLLRTAFGIRGLTSAYISRVFVRTEMSLKSRSVVSGNRQLTRSRSSDNLPTNQSQVDIQMVSHTLTIREGASSPEEHVASQGFYPVHHVNSHIIDHDGLLTLWSWLPVRITMYQPVLLYTTEEHGCSLTTFYHRVEQHEPTLLMIKTSNNEVFGAYCSTRWVERNLKDDKGNRQAYFGTGETFLFTLYPERAKYPWVGTQKNLGDRDDERPLDHSAELFMAADAKMLTIGGGGSQALWMDENVRYGKTDHCDTFNNPPLCATRDFEIRVLEVYGFVTH